MRTTLNLDDDLLLIAKQLALQRGQTAGQVVSALVRQGLKPRARSRSRNGVPLFTPRRGAKRPSLALVNQLRDTS